MAKYQSGTMGIDKELIYECLDMIGAERNIRAEQLTIDMMAEFANCLADMDVMQSESKEQ